MGHDFLHSAIIFLSAAVIGALIFKKLGMGSILGYLISGILIGPSAFGFISEVEEVLHFSELGVVFFSVHRWIRTRAPKALAPKKVDSWGRKLSTFHHRSCYIHFGTSYRMELEALTYRLSRVCSFFDSHWTSIFKRKEPCSISRWTKFILNSSLSRYRLRPRSRVASSARPQSRGE